jgi:hypothetical protein
VISQVALRWLASVPVSCLHASEAFLRKRPLADPLLSAALAAPAERLQAALLEEGVPADVFWSHVVPLAAGIVGVRELAQVTLIKTIGRSEAAPRVPCFRDRLAELLNAFDGILPQLSEDWTTGIEPLRQRWDCLGGGLLARIVERTEPALLVDAATIVLVYPALRGGGAAYLPYNLLHIEVQPTEPVAELPEVVRLAWMVSLLNMDLPRYSEGLRPRRLGTVAALAMIPVTLAAAADLELAGCDAESIERALHIWLPPAAEIEARTSMLSQWWETYSAVRPAWVTALQALDRLLEGTGTGTPG